MKLVNENLFEFKKGLDPVSSLGIQEFNWESLRPGYILKSIKHFGYSKFGRLGGYLDSAKRIETDQYFLICGIKNINTYKKIYMYNFKRSLERAQVEQLNLLNSKPVYYSFMNAESHTEIILSKLQFTNRFEILRILPKI